jgi:iron complex transport system substrate-binding protein
MRRPFRFVLFAALAAIVSLIAAACGDSGSTPAATGTPNTTTTVAANKPQRIISLSPTATEMLFAIGAGKQVVAVDDQSNYPPEAPRTDLSGYQPNIEAIAAKKPDLVVVQYDSDGVLGKLATLKIPTLTLPSAKTFDESYAQMQKLGETTGNEKGATDAVQKMKSRLDDLAKKAPKPERKLRYYHEVDNTLYTATSKTFIGQVYALAGLENVADSADKDGSGFPQLSAEYLVSQNPDLVFLADTKCCAQNAKTFGDRPGFGTLAAVKAGAVIELDDDLASRWGPRTPDFLEQVVNAVSKHATLATSSR